MSSHKTQSVFRWQSIWCDDRGAVLSIELVLLATIILLGILVGMSAYRDGIVLEVGDTAAAVGSLQHGYSVNPTEVDDEFISELGPIPYIASTDGSVYVDELDFGEPQVPASPDPPCIMIDAATIREEQ